MRYPRFFSFSSLPLPLLSLALATGLLLTVSSSGCGTDRACFYWTELEGSCPSQGEALDFFQGDFCSSSISSVDSEGAFEGDTCCYDVTEDSSNFATCSPEPGVPGPSVAVGVGGFGGVGGASGGGGVAGTGGVGGAGGGSTCASCKQFLLDEMPPELCPASVPLYEAFTDCKCLGACASVCGEACMSNQVPASDCENCLLDNSSNGCGMQFLACSNDGN
ncbi:hypothetical protein [Polyangium jinanense]|uniref:Uncharacterized protein n=1 Tax=Polyangium jinanense TaxID=2829994 RepID=A0A9X3XB65_9BACT|nr:hypothetical protein [Polyangium jinanense]MDC3956502.1 hypothetical protein [Polyangium jinanense]MDC3985533.1 hypothetical protein [Polyangium jinanense]